MADAKCLDPALLAQGKSDEKTKLDQLGDCEMLLEFLPKRIVGDVGVPGDGAGISERDFFTLGKFIGIFKVK